MKTLFMIIFACNVLCGSVVAQDGNTGSSQTYIIFIDGDRAGKETVSDKRDSNGDWILESENEIYLTDGVETNRMAFTTRMILDGKSRKPKHYVYRYETGNSGDSYEVLIQGDSITRTLHRGAETSVVTASYETDTVILDFNVYHQYDLLLEKYDNRKGGRQVFTDFIPVIGSGIPVALTFIGTSDIQYKNKNLSVRNYQIEFVGIRSGTISADENRQLLRLQMPDQNLEVVREDVLPANR